MRLQVKVIPNARRSEFVEWFANERGEEVLKTRLAAPPVDGKANKALIAFLAKSLAVPKSGISLIHGAKSRSKVFEIGEIDDEATLRDRIGLG